MTYYPSFKPHQVEEYVEAFHRDGFVVVDDVLSPEECAKSCGEIWDYLEKDSTILRDEPSTWNNENWPKEICRNGGFMGKFPYWKRMKKLDDTHINQQPQAWRNRQNKTIYEVFSNLMNHKKLWVSLDRYGIMRPTKLKSDETHDNTMDEKPEWRTKVDWLHWDLSPFHFGTSAAGFAPRKVSKEELSKEYGYIRVQGLVAVSDCDETTGGFHCVPKFHGDRFYDWANDNRESYGTKDDIRTRNFIEVPDNDPMRKEITRVPIRAGSLIIWNSQLPHGNFPNTGNKFRMVQYIKMIPVDDPREFLPPMSLNRFQSEEWFGKEFAPSGLGRRLFGLDKWDEEDV